MMISSHTIILSSIIHIIIIYIWTIRKQVSFLINKYNVYFIRLDIKILFNSKAKPVTGLMKETSESDQLAKAN